MRSARCPEFNPRRAGQAIDNQKGWLFLVAHNLAKNRRRRNKLLDLLDAGDFDDGAANYLTPRQALNKHSFGEGQAI